MKNWKLFIFTIFTIISCFSTNTITAQKTMIVSDQSELKSAIAGAQPGSEIILKNGYWKDVQIKFYGNGSQENPISLRAETPGKVYITGKSDLKLGGKHLIVEGLYFIDGYSPTRSVIQYFINQDTLANHCRVTNCVIEDFNKPQRNMADLWVSFKGRHNQLDHCYLAGKANRGPTIRINIEGNESINNYHKIVNNHFGPRPPKGGPSAETIQIGNSYTSVSPSYTIVADNFFERCDGEVEVISSKTNYNEFRNNIFYKSEGSLVTRHGNYCTVDGNYFIGDENSSNYGGVRLIGTGHWVTNNYFYKLKGEIFRAPLAVMNGIRKSPLNRYIQVTDVVVAHNTYVDCTSPWQFGVGSNIDQKEVLPASEIRSETPIRTIVANNVIYNSIGDKLPIFRHDSIDGIKFESNIINNNNVPFRGVKGLQEKNFSFTQLEQNIWGPSSGLEDIAIYKGFEFDKISKDLFGNSREKKNLIGAISKTQPDNKSFIIPSNYGPEWYDSNPIKPKTTTYKVSNSKELVETLNLINHGDIIQLTAQSYELKSSLKINKKVIIESTPGNAKSTISFKGAAMTPAFELNPKGELILNSVNLIGSSDNYAFATKQQNMSSHYNLTVNDSKIENFDYILKAYKYSFALNISFNTSQLEKCNNGIELSAEDDDKGDYNAENVYIENCKFLEIQQNVIDYYRGGYDESTVGGNLKLINNTFEKCAKKEKNETLINTYGIINVNISDNYFNNNEVKNIAQLWGAKNNFESKNTIKKSGSFITLQNLPQKLMY